MRPWLLALVALLLGSMSASSWAQDTGPYVTNGECDGFPKVNLTTASGLCAGLVGSHLGFVRGIAALGTDLYVTDMGGWGGIGRGKILRLRDNGHGKPETVLANLDQPSSIAPAPGNMLYIGVLGKIIRYNPATQAVNDIIVHLPVDGQHPLSAFAVAPDGSLFVNVGSGTDHCEKEGGSAPDPAAPCPEASSHLLPRGAIVHIMPQATPIDAQTLTAYATGLRNSIALTVLPSGQLYAGVNSRDIIDQADPSLSDEDLPHDTLNLVREGQEYGWPYCYDNNIPNPEYPHYDCSKKQLPTLLLPPHAAPLGMLLYKGNLLPGLKDKLIIGYHGYRAKGHRIVALALDKKQMPKGTPVDIISGWDAKPGDHPMGAPVGLLELEDGSIIVAEDRNGTLLRIARTPQKQ
ncbi:MAG TPA: PQQ-dependent sugar dehydrogenase [Rickettsiales bacterium]|nr:PQQ-dependent sugar dehydrogenase [Rickettsiales bacterium]